MSSSVAGQRLHRGHQPGMHACSLSPYYHDLTTSKNGQSVQHDGKVHADIDLQAANTPQKSTTTKQAFQSGQAAVSQSAYTTMHFASDNSCVQLIAANPCTP